MTVTDPVAFKLMDVKLAGNKFPLAMTRSMATLRGFAIYPSTAVRVLARRRRQLVCGDDIHILSGQTPLQCTHQLEAADHSDHLARANNRQLGNPALVHGDDYVVHRGILVDADGIAGHDGSDAKRAHSLARGSVFPDPQHCLDPVSSRRTYTELVAMKQVP